MTAKRTYVTKRKLGGVPMNFRKWEEYKEGDIVIGKYVDTHQDQYENDCPVIEVLEAFFKDKSGDKLVGKNLVLNSCGSVDKAFKKAALGDIVQVTYTGKGVIERGKYAGKDAHSVVIEQVEEDTGSVEL